MSSRHRRKALLIAITVGLIIMLVLIGDMCPALT